MQNCKIERKPFSQSGYDCLAHRRLHFGRDSGHRHQYFSVSVEPHNGSSSHPVGQHIANIGYISLRAGRVVHLESPFPKQLLVVPEYRVIEYHRASEIIAQCLFGNIVFRRAQSAGHQHGIDPGKSLIQRRRDFRTPVAYGRDFGNLPSNPIHFPGNPSRIGIGHLTDQQFIADNNDFRIHLY